MTEKQIAAVEKGLRHTARKQVTDIYDELKAFYSEKEWNTEVHPLVFNMRSSLDHLTGEVMLPVVYSMIYPGQGIQR